MFRNSSFAITAFALMGCFLLVIAVLGAGDGIARWIRAKDFIASSGVVVVSEIRERPGRHGPVPYGYVEYEYQVGGKTFRSAQVTVDGAEAVALTGRYPKGTAVVVWHNSGDPADAVLLRGFTRTLMMLCLGGSMFLGCALVLILDAVDAVAWRARRLPGGVTIRPMASGEILHIPAYSALAIGAFAAFLVSMLVLVAWMIFSVKWGGMFVGPVEAAALIALMLLPGPFAYFYERYLARSGRRDLIIDRAMNTITVPPGPNRKRIESIPIAAVMEVEVAVWEHEVQTQHVRTTTYTYVPSIVHRVELGRPRNCHLVEWRDEGKAQALAKWLRQRLNAPSAKVGAGGRDLGGERLRPILDGIDTR